jgi:aerobic carbon-monoxide dehydrogenase medium subunit
MSGAGPGWLSPASVEEALELKAKHGEDAIVLAGGTFLGILMNQGFLVPKLLLHLGGVAGLDGADGGEGELRLGAMVRHRAVERSPLVGEDCPVLARTFALVASPRVRNQATVGGVLADADYASDPPAMLSALEARVVLRSAARGQRVVAVDELITGHYETCIAADELLVEVRVPTGHDAATYRKFRSRSSEDRPCVAVAALRRGPHLRVVVGAVAERPQHFPDVCELATGAPIDETLATEIGRRYAERIQPMSDARGSARYRRRVIAVEVRRAVMELAA